MILRYSNLAAGTPNALSRCCIRTGATLYFKSDWASIIMKSSYAFIRKIDNPNDSDYDKVTLSPTSLQWGTEHSRAYGSKSIPFVFMIGKVNVLFLTYCYRYLVVTNGFPPDIGLDHGTDAITYGDQAGMTSATF